MLFRSRPGVISVAHGYGVLPGEPEDPFGRGASTNRLIGAKGPRESINAMPRMSAIPVNVMPLGLTAPSAARGFGDSAELRA